CGNGRQPGASIRAELRREFSLGRSGGRRGRFQVMQQLTYTPIDLDLFEQLLLEFDWQRQREGDNVAQGAERQIAFEEFAELIEYGPLRGKPSGHQLLHLAAQLASGFLARRRDVL